MTEVDARLLACDSPKVPTGEDQGDYAEVLCNYESDEVRKTRLYPPPLPPPVVENITFILHFWQAYIIQQVVML